MTVKNDEKQIAKRGGVSTGEREKTESTTLPHPGQQTKETMFRTGLRMNAPQVHGKAKRGGGG